MSDVTEKVEFLLRRAVEEQGLELVHVQYVSQQRSPLLRIYIDKPGGVTLEDCQNVSRQAGVLLDVEDLISDRYVLEVSSPGLDRPLFRAEDYERFSGREVRVVTHEKIDSRRKFTGFIQGLRDDAVQLSCQDKIYRIPFGMISKANLVYRFADSSRK
jgi:ribosome maturation factor RimP